MHILHICNDFLGTTAHISLFKELDELGVVQTVFIPIKTGVDSNKRTIDFKTFGSSIVYSRRQSKIIKYLYGYKISKLVHDVERKVNLNEIDLIHASVMCNEGAIAYELYKKYSIPYLTAVRNTDINSYIRIFKWRCGYFKQIAENAKKIIFISSQYTHRFISILHIEDQASIQSKFMVIHNGLQDFYLDNKYENKKNIHDPIKIVVTGAFVRNKNIHTLFKAVNSLRVSGLNVELSAIGNNLATYQSDKKYANKVLSLSKNTPWFQTYEAQPKEELYKTLRSHDIFALVSFRETFGLSYLEALSQGLPIVFTRGEGFDNTYQEGLVGYSALATDSNSIARALKTIIDNYDKIVDNILHLDLSVYRWRNIAEHYLQLYNTIVNKK